MDMISYAVQRCNDSKGKMKVDDAGSNSSGSQWFFMGRRATSQGQQERVPSLPRISAFFAIQVTWCL